MGALDRLREWPVEMAREELLKMPGVGRKIADCVLLFAYGFQTAFPVDVALGDEGPATIVFPAAAGGGEAAAAFSETHFGPNAGASAAIPVSLHANEAYCEEMKTVEVLFTPADFSALYRRKLDRSLCVVFDVFRATSTMVTALANRATAIIPVDDIPSAINMKHQLPSVLLAGERDGLRIRARVSGGTEFDLGNSPREFTREKVAGKMIVMTTTNGTHALRSCAHAKAVVVGSFLNLRA